LIAGQAAIQSEAEALHQFIINSIPQGGQFIFIIFDWMTRLVYQCSIISNRNESNRNYLMESGGSGRASTRRAAGDRPVQRRRPTGPPPATDPAPAGPTTVERRLIAG